VGALETAGFLFSANSGWRHPPTREFLGTDVPVEFRRDGIGDLISTSALFMVLRQAC
jgi:hypothetical protein